MTDTKKPQLDDVQLKELLSSMEEAILNGLVTIVSIKD